MAHDPLDLRARERAKADADEARRLARETEVADFKRLMAEQWGRRFVWRLLQQAGVYRSSFTGDNETFFREGQRNLGLMLVADIHALCPENYHLMVKENQGV